MWSDKLKEAGVSIHVIATGGGAGLQQNLWSIPGSSAYLSGASFPYATEETEELLGFKPESFCSEDAAIDLASAAYMKAYRLGGKKPVGLGITASVASEKAHRGDHRVHACIITNDMAKTCSYTLAKGVGIKQRAYDGEMCDDLGFFLLIDSLASSELEFTHPDHPFLLEEAGGRTRARFFERPFFSADGKRSSDIPRTNDHALMAGSFNPPHQGHLGIADAYRRAYGKNVVFEIGTNPPHKTKPTVQELLQRAKLLHGRDVFFSTDVPLFIDKARAFPGMPLLVGADTLIRLFDPKWGVDINGMLESYKNLGTKFAVSGRTIDGKFVSGWEAVVQCLGDKYKGHFNMFVEMPGRWDVSSTELRTKGASGTL